MSIERLGDKMDILFIAIGGVERASTRYRVHNLLPHLSKKNVSYTVLQAPIGESAVVKAQFASRVIYEAWRNDLIYSQKVLLPGYLIDIVKKTGAEYVFDFDDALYTSPIGKKTPRDRVRQLDNTLSKSSLVIAGSPLLKSYADQLANKCVVHSTGVPKEEYDPLADMVVDDNKIRIGWIGYGVNLQHLNSKSKVLEGVLDKYPQLELNVISSPHPEIRPLNDRDDVKYKEWSIENELKFLARADIGIRPLIDDEYTRAKGGFTSVVQCMGLGLPVVTTPLGILSEIIEHNENGFLASSEKEWQAYLSKLIDDEQIRDDFGSKARDSLSNKRMWTHQYAEDLYLTLSSL
ncbi:glycosyltransferase family 4 protein [Haloferax prahovense]|uniref:glycosyltransferase family 4 protein n=1 Tax=Haloferax prahovense TaxID=381852 RepID=UPI003C738FB4